MSIDATPDELAEAVLRVPGFKVMTVNRDPNNQRGHPHLYKKLAQLLRDRGADAPPDTADL